MCTTTKLPYGWYIADEADETLDSHQLIKVYQFHPALRLSRSKSSFQKKQAEVERENAKNSHFFFNRLTVLFKSGHKTRLV